MKTCAGCKEETSVYFMCDEVLEDLVWCEVCFEKTQCGKGEHGEGCPTKVFDSCLK